MRPAALATLGALMAGSVSSVCRADTEVNAAMTGGVATLRMQDQGTRVGGHLGLYADAIFTRKRSRDWGVGPHVDFTTLAFATAEPGAGASGLIPVGDVILMPRITPFLRLGDSGGSRAGLAASLFIGGRSHNFSGTYTLGNGGYLQVRRSLASDERVDFLIGAQIDMAYVALPFIFAVQALGPGAGL
jgi:hypothetical protein